MPPSDGSFFFESDGFNGIFTFQKLHFCVFFPDEFRISDGPRCYELLLKNFLRQNQHFFSQKQTKILLDWLHEACWFGRNFAFPLLVCCKFRLKVVLGGKGSTWRGGGQLLKRLQKQHFGRGKTCYKSHREWGNFPIGVEVKNPRILKMDKKREGQTGIKRLAKAYWCLAGGLVLHFWSVNMPPVSLI